MSTGVLAIIVSLVLSLTMINAEAAATQQILPDPLAKLDIKDAVMVSTRGVPKGRLTIGQHYALDPGWLDPIQYGTSLTQQHYSYLVHDALIKPMPQGVHTYSLAEQAEMTADFTKAVFRLRPGLKFHDGHPLTTADVKWTYEHYKGVNFKLLHDKLEHIEIVDDRTIIFHFKEPFVDFLDLYNGGNTGIGWISPQHYYERVGPSGFKERPLGAGPFKFVSQEAGVQMVFEAWEEYWRQTPGVKTIMVKGIGDPATRLAWHDREGVARGDAQAQPALGPELHLSLVPGPEMLVPEPRGRLTLSYSLVWIIVVSNVLTVTVCMLVLNPLAKITEIRGSLLTPLIVWLIFVGAFAEKNAFADLIIVLIFGALWWMMVQLDWPRPPLLLGLVLASLAEIDSSWRPGAMG